MYSLKHIINWQKGLSVSLAFLLLFSAGCDWFDNNDDPEPEPPSDISSLASLTVSEGSLSPSFTILGTAYTVDVENAVESIQVTATLESDVATLQINGEAVTSGAASNAISLDVGANIINVVATAESGASRTITITVTRAELLSDNALLSSLAISNGSLSPDFDSTIFSYTNSVSFTTNSMTITPILADGNASILIEGIATDSGEASAEIELEEGENSISIEVTAEDGTTHNTYSIAVTRESANIFAQQAFIKASNTGYNDRFGVSVSISGDTLAVGAQQEQSDSIGVNQDQDNDNATDSGAVYVFVREDDVWSQQAYIKASNTDATDFFGLSIALDGDTLAVGASLEDGNSQGINQTEDNNDAEASGAVYIFTRSDGNWSQQAYIKSSNSEAIDRFGYSLDLSGNTLAVGAYREDSNSIGINQNESNNDAVDSGAVYIFTRTDNSWTQQAYIKASNTDAGDLFGVSVALDENTLAVSAIDEQSNLTGINSDEANNDGLRTGAVYIFTRTNNLWTQQSYIKPSNISDYDLFGYSLALLNNTLAVGVYLEDSDSTGINHDDTNNNSPDSGAVYLFNRIGNDWFQEAYLKASNTDSLDYFGYRISLAGNNLAVSALSERSSSVGINQSQANNDVVGAGAVYLFTKENGLWEQKIYIKASNTDFGDGFGSAVVLTNETLVVGAWAEDSSATGINGEQSDNSTEISGAVYVFKIGDVSKVAN